MDLGKAERERRETELRTVFQTVLHEGRDSLRAERSTLYVVDRKRGEIWSKVATGTGTHDGGKHKQGFIAMDMHAGLAGHCVATGALVNIHNAYEHAAFNSAYDEASGFKTRAVLCVPIKDDSQTSVVAVAQFINKVKLGGTAAEEEDEDGGEEGFTREDEKLARMLGTHVGIFMSEMARAGDD